MRVDAFVVIGVGKEALRINFKLFDCCHVFYWSPDVYVAHHLVSGMRSTLSGDAREVACFDGTYDNFENACMASSATEIRCEDIAFFVPPGAWAASGHMETLLCWFGRVCILGKWAWWVGGEPLSRM